MTDDKADRRTTSGDRKTDSIQTNVRTQASARFAKAIARSEFGRHYWDEGREQELRDARRRKPDKGK